MLAVAPMMFNHKWEAKSKGYELLIEVPKNIKGLITFKEKRPSPEPYEEVMHSELLTERLNIFKQALYNRTYNHYLKSKEQHKDVPSYRDIIDLIDPLTDN